MGQVNWDAFNKPGYGFDHQLVAEKLAAYMETGHHGLARELLDNYAKEWPERSDTLRLSLVRTYGTGL